MKFGGSMRSKRGISLIEVIVATLLFVLVGFIFSRYMLNLSSSQSQSEELWRAQLNTESIVESIASLNESQLHSLISKVITKDHFNNPDFYIDSSRASWLNEWTQKGKIENARFQILLYEPTDPPGINLVDKAGGIPDAEQLQFYDILVRARIELVRNGRQSLIEWEKWIAHQVASF